MFLILGGFWTGKRHQNMFMSLKKNQTNDCNIWLDLNGYKWELKMKFVFTVMYNDLCT